MRYRSIAAFLILFLICIQVTEGENVVLSEGSAGVNVLEQQQNRTVLQLNIPTIELQQVESAQGQISRVKLPKEFESSSGAVLTAENVLLPTITRMIAIPFDSEPVLRVTRSSYKELNNVTLAQATEEEIESYYTEDRNPSLNSSDEIVSAKVAGIMRDIRIYSITAIPVKYNPETSTLDIYDNIEIEIDHAGAKLTKYGNQISEAFAPIYRSILDNPAVFDPVEVTRGGYWIIYPDNYESQIQPLVKWKHHKGFSVETIARSEFGTYPSHISIKNYITSRYDTCQVKPDYIAIVGDVTMPSNQGIPTRNYPNPHGQGDIESDNYYTFIEGNDYFPEIFIGRISIDGISDLSSYLTKLFSYERTPYMGDTDWYLRATVISGGDDGYFVSPRITKLWCADRMKDVGFTNVDTLFDSYSNYVSPAEINASINSGVSFVNYRGYGTASGWAGPYYTYSNLSSLYNGPKYPVMTSIVCGTGDFNDYVDICFGEYWIRLNGKGGPGFIGNTNHYAHTVWTNAIDCGIYWGLFVENVSTLAQAQYMGKITLWHAFPDDQYPGGQVELYFNSYNILGDPELNCWTGIPQNLVVSYPESLQFGQNLLSVQVDDYSGDPLEDAYVCVTNDNDVFTGGFTSQDGSINFDVQPNNAGDLYVTVTSRNYAPHEGVVTYYNSDVAVGYSAHLIDDDNNGQSSGNGNGIANPTETIELGVDLHNYGQSVTANGVSAVLSSESPFITVTQNTASYGDIAPGQSASATQPYLIEVASNALDAVTVDLLLAVSDNSGHSWNSVVQIPIEAAQFTVDEVTILDNGNGQIDPGEIFEIYLLATNSGSNGMTGASAILRTNDDQVTIYDSMAVFGDCTPGGYFDNLNDTFMLSVDSDIYVGHLINFTLEFTDANSQNVTAAFNQVVGTVSSDDPIGPDNYGYYCLDNTDTDYIDHPTYDWIDINIQDWPFVQTPDDDVQVLTLPFTVSYYGQLYDEITVCDNGYVAMGQSWWNAWHNAPIPAPQDASAMIAPFWDDLKYSSYSSMGPRIYYHYDDTNGYFILGYYNAWADDVYRNETFEIIIRDTAVWPTETGDNEIIFQYYDVNSAYSASVGICSPDRRDGIEYLFDSSYADGAANLIDGRAIKFTTGSSYNTGIGDATNIPDEFSLSRSYPNPFNASATIEFSIPKSENVRLDIFNLLGQKVATLIDGRLDAGTHRVVWNAAEQTSGVYFYKLNAGDFESSKRMTLLK
jgi:hypothetical protein